MPENKLVANIYINFSYLSQELAFAYISFESCKTIVFTVHTPLCYGDQTNTFCVWDSAGDGCFVEAGLEVNCEQLWEESWVHPNIIHVGYFVTLLDDGLHRTVNRLWWTEWSENIKYIENQLNLHQ